MNTASKNTPLFTVSQLTNAIKHCLEGTFPAVWIQGEISNCKIHSSGHLYFSMKDANAQIAAVMFRANASTLPRRLKDGDSVIAYGSLNVYPQSGKYQIIVTELKIAGLGELLLRLEELKRKLHERGWFSKLHKKAIPKMPKKIGVVTSPTGAAIQDILHILKRRFSGFHLILNPVKVQGEGAAQEIAKAIYQLNEKNLVDVIIVGRGGGSIEDLWAFNEEIVAEAIFRSHIPIIAAVGHETDHCIADYVADLRAPTPSAAAELVIAEKSEQMNKLYHFQKRLDGHIHHFVTHWRHRYESALKQPLLRNPYALLGYWMQKLDDLRQSLDYAINQGLKERLRLVEGKRKHVQLLNPQSKIIHSKERLKILSNLIERTFYRRLSVHKEELRRLATALKSVDPKNLLKRGYSILFSEKEQFVISSVRDVSKKERLKVLLSDGQLLSTVDDILLGP